MRFHTTESELMKRYRHVLAGAAVLIGLGMASASAVAASIPVFNHSFEDPDVGGSFAAGVPTGWTDASSGNPFIENSAAVGFTGGEGLQYFGFEGGEVHQDLGVAFAPNTTYTVDVASAHRETFTHSTLEFGLYDSNAIGVDLATPGFADIQGVWDGSGNPDGDNLWNTLRDASVLAAIGSGALGDVYTFTTGPVVPSGNVAVFLRVLGDSGNRVNVDNVRVTANALPEPSGAMIAVAASLVTTLLNRR